MIHQCCVCLAVMRTTAEPPLAAVSHGLCPECAGREIEKLALGTANGTCPENRQ